MCGTQPEAIMMPPSCKATGFPTDSTAYHAMAHAANPFGDGHAAIKIVNFITNT